MPSPRNCRCSSPRFRSSPATAFSVLPVLRRCHCWARSGSLVVNGAGAGGGESVRAVATVPGLVDMLVAVARATGGRSAAVRLAIALPAAVRRATVLPAVVLPAVMLPGGWPLGAGVGPTVTRFPGVPEGLPSVTGGAVCRELSPMASIPAGNCSPAAMGEMVCKVSPPPPQAPSVSSSQGDRCSTICRALFFMQRVRKIVQPSMVRQVNGLRSMASDQWPDSRIDQRLS